MRGTVEDESEQLAFPPAAIEAVDEFIQVPLEVLWAHPVKGAPEPSLEVAEKCVAPRQDLRRVGAIGALPSVNTSRPPRRPRSWPPT